MGFEDFIQGVGKRLHDFGKRSQASARQHSARLTRTAVTVDDFGKNTLRPAFDEVGNAFDGFRKKKVAPAVKEPGKCIEQHGYYCIRYRHVSLPWPYL